MSKKDFADAAKSLLKKKDYAAEHLLDDDKVVSNRKEIKEVRLDLIDTNEHQPRQTFNQEKLQAFAYEIKEDGVLFPIKLKRVGGRYEIIAGERRYRASLLAGKGSIPAFIVDADDKTYPESLIENIVREDLSPLDESIGIQKLLKLYDKTQQEVAVKLTRTQGYVSQALKIAQYMDQHTDLADIIRQAEELHDKRISRELLYQMSGMSIAEARSLIEKSLVNTATVRQVRQMHQHTTTLDDKQAMKKIDSLLKKIDFSFLDKVQCVGEISNYVTKLSEAREKMLTITNNIDKTIRSLNKR